MRFRVCIAGRNHAAFTEQCLSSVLAQTGDFEIDWTDDASEDGGKAFELADHMLRDQRVAHSYVELRLERRGGLANIWHAIHRADDDDVCVLMGGDDWLEPGALERVRREYENPETWLTYGSYTNARPSGRPRVDDPKAICREWNGCDIRPYDFLWVPLTCKAWLAKKILEQDLQIAGWWQWSGGDVALNIPMVEMAGPEHARFISDVWYTRRLHDQNDGTVDCNFQYYCNWVSYGRPRYSRLSSRSDTPTRTPHHVKYSLLFSPMLSAPRAVLF